MTSSLTSATTVTVMTTITDPYVIAQYKWMSLRSYIALHQSVPAFKRTQVLHVCRRSGFTGRTLEQARRWVDIQCDEMGLTRTQGLPPPRDR